MATLEEDFTFPATTTTPLPRFIDSPPFWRCSTAPSPTSHLTKSPENSKDKGEDKEEKLILRSFQEFEANIINKRDIISNDDEEEEKMDMLWEDLNDEFSKNSGKITRNSCDVSSPEIKCVKALKLSKNNGHVISEGVIHLCKSFRVVVSCTILMYF
ncbi:hypothetical protein ACS0TY_028680 [Phlomoides rotata]